MSMTMYGRQLVLGSVWAPELVTRPNTVQVALTLSVPVINADVTQLVEPAATEYARASYGVGAAYWSFDGYGGLFNIVEIDFPVVQGNWGLILGYAIIDPGNSAIIDSGALMEPFNAVIGVAPVLAAQSLSLSLAEVY